MRAFINLSLSKDRNNYKKTNQFGPRERPNGCIVLGSRGTRTNPQYDASVYVSLLYILIGNCFFDTSEKYHNIEQVYNLLMEEEILYRIHLILS